MGATHLIQNRTDISLEEFYELQETIAVENLIIDNEPINRVEYYNGEVWFMAGGTKNHADIGDNLYFNTRLALKNKNCKPHSPSKSLAIDSLRLILYPDMFISCGDIENSKFDKNGITNASVIFEVLSKSTEGYDRGEKFRKYKNIPQLKEYILVNQYKPLVESYIKQAGNDIWAMRYNEGLETDLHIRTLDIKIPMKLIYEGINFEKI